MCGISTFCKIPAMDDYSISFYFPFRHKPGMSLFDVSDNLPIEWCRELADVLGAEDKIFDFHNFKFDAHMLEDDGIVIHKNALVRDTAIAAHMLDEEMKHDLDTIGLKYAGLGKEEVYDLRGRKVKKADYWKQAPKIIEPYACKDAEVTYRSWLGMVPLLQEQGLLQMYEEQEMPLLRLLYAAERRGVGVDLELAERLSQETQERMRDVEDALGFDPQKLEELAHRLFGTPPVGQGLQPGPLTSDTSSRFPNGIPSTAEEILTNYDNPVVDNVLEYRGLVKANSTWYEGFAQKSRSDGRLHPNFNQAGTVTSRQSCSQPNLHQMPRNVTDFPARRLLLPDPGFQMWELDYDQIEARIGAVYTKSEVMIEAFRKGEDVHQANADALGGVSRQTAKHGLYTISYGGGVPTLADTLSRLEWQTTGRKVPASEFQEISEEFFSKFYEVNPGFKKVARDAQALIHSRGWVQYWDGRRRHIGRKFCKKHKKVDLCGAHKAFNSICQGGAARIINESMRRVGYHESHGKRFWLDFQVHDSLWMEISDHFREDTIAELIEIMEWPGREKFPIPFTVSAKMVNDSKRTPVDLEEVA